MKTLVFDIPGHGGPLMVPDSAILRGGRPFFVPDTATRWRYYACMAWPVVRLGKSIAPKFAARYLGDPSLCVLSLPDPAPAGCLATVHDGALIVGDAVGQAETLSVRAGDTGISAEVKRGHERACACVAEASRYCTLKTGDMIVASPAELGVDLPLDITVSGPGLEYRIK